MNIKISNRQLAFLVSNSMVSVSLVILPQSLVDLSLQNAWLVFPLLFLFVLLIITGGLYGLKKLKTFDLTEGQGNWQKRCLAFLFVLFISHVLIRDLTIITGFIEATLLPLTPVYVITILVIACSLYISWAGIEVIARYNEICFLIFLGVVLFIPISLIDSLAIENFEPVLGLETIPSVFQSAYLGLAWVGEIIIVFLIIGMVNPLKNVKRAIFLGGAIGIGMLFILIFSGIAVLGAEILRYTTYPTYTLVQQIRITEFLDRLDFFLVSLYFPAVFSKFALFFFWVTACF
ncbi:GerAB/ArcD/ProY family transporter [Halalkalibacter akibai]|uniref:Spore germination protein GerKB n=1 Tax=Halalkalibacter akibai (strain ATCC 43226 / DSM 21942 / CIP 109018 / JCM 9157 / 1139) TaxID=1236973 RepID=W4QR42_HALA3|nr:endospore germination permease [Halalkalibacter akibai]GAE34392.1 spore germination protein GerKB [Halalkalibacter akibai JCM 9157]